DQRQRRVARARRVAGVVDRDQRLALGLARLAIVIDAGGAAVAGRFVHPKHACEGRDVARVVEGRGEGVAALATGYDSAFSVMWPEGSALLLGRLVEAWTADAGAGGVAERLGRAVLAARDVYLREALALVTDPDDLGAPDASLVAIAAGA